MPKISSKRNKNPNRRPVLQSSAVDLDLSEANGTVAEIFPNLCSVLGDQDQKRVLCTFRRKVRQSVKAKNTRERSLVAVGDRVKFQKTQTSDGDEGVIDGICVRERTLYRSAPGREGQVLHAMATHVDLLVVVSSSVEPEFSPRIIDRFFIAARTAGIPVVVVVNKMDLLTGGVESLSEVEGYRSLGVTVLGVSAKEGKGLDRLRDEIQSKRVVFCGHSGVGKTTLLNTLLGRTERTGAVNSLTGKGKHTTTGAVLLEGPQGAQWIDTPGVREFTLVDVDPENIFDTFPEMNSSEFLEPHENPKKHEIYQRILQAMQD